MAETSPLDPKAKEAGLRILKRAFKDYAASDDPDDFKEVLMSEIVKQRPDLADNQRAIANIGRVLSSRFFEIIADQENYPSKKKQDLMIEQFLSGLRSS